MAQRIVGKQTKSNIHTYINRDKTNVDTNRFLHALYRLLHNLRNYVGIGRDDLQSTRFNPKTADL